MPTSSTLELSPSFRKLASLLTAHLPSGIFSKDAIDIGTNLLEGPGGEYRVDSEPIFLSPKILGEILVCAVRVELSKMFNGRKGGTISQILSAPEIVARRRDRSPTLPDHHATSIRLIFSFNAAFCHISVL